MQVVICSVEGFFNNCIEVRIVSVVNFLNCIMAWQILCQPLHRLQRLLYLPQVAAPYLYGGFLAARHDLTEYFYNDIKITVIETS